MKILLTFFFLFFSTTVLGEEKVYYCVEDASTGFHSSNNYKEVDFVLRKFTAKIDFQNLYFSSPDLFMTYADCEYTNIYDHLMQCTTVYGSMITINKNNLKFGLADLLGIGKDSDSLSISHGSCSSF
tara:strand:- start:36 stop:416 length:381 start_codon:yes stop_codon:yes gene_type:complete